MAQEHLIARLGGWAGDDVVQDWQEQRAGHSWCVLRLQAVPGWLRQCSHCGEFTPAVHDQQDRRVRDLPLFAHVIPSKIFEAWGSGRPVILGVRGESAGIVEKAAGGRVACQAVKLDKSFNGRDWLRVWLPAGTGPADDSTHGQWARESCDAFEESLRKFIGSDSAPDGGAP